MRNIFLLLLLVLSGCGRQRSSLRTKLGTDYYRMSTLELEGAESEEKNYRKALRYINKALAEECRPEYLAQKATLLFLLGKDKGSLRVFNTALKMPVAGSVRLEILNNYACLLARQGRKQEALVMFDQLAQDKAYVTPEVALVNQAKIYYEDGEFLKAKLKLGRAVDIAPDYVDAHYYLGLACCAMKDYKSSLWSLHKTLDLEPSHYGARSLQALIKGS